MSRYQNLMTEILDAIFEGYTVDNKGKLKVVNESSAKKASEKLHTLVLEKSRDLWDQLEAAEDSLSGVAEEISFEELNADPSSMANTVSHRPNDAEISNSTDDEIPTLESLLDVDGFDLSDIFENEKDKKAKAHGKSAKKFYGKGGSDYKETYGKSKSKSKVKEHGMDHLDNISNKKSDGHMPFDEEGGDHYFGEMPGGMKHYEDDADDVEDGDEDYDDLMIGMDDEGMGSPDTSTGMDDMDYENGDMENDDMENDDMDYDDENGDMDYDDENGDMDMNGDEEGEDMGFDFDLDLEGDDYDETVPGEEEELEGLGHHDKSYRMEDYDDKKSKDYYDKKSKVYDDKKSKVYDDKKSKVYDDKKSKDYYDKKSKVYDDEEKSKADDKKKAKEGNVLR